MPDEHRIRLEGPHLGQDLLDLQRAKLGIDQLHEMSGIEQRTAQQQSSPSGGRCSRGIRLPIAGCGGLKRRILMGNQAWADFDVLRRERLGFPGLRLGVIYSLQYKAYR